MTLIFTVFSLYINPHYKNVLNTHCLHTLDEKYWFIGLNIKIMLILLMCSILRSTEELFRFWRIFLLWSYFANKASKLSSDGFIITFVFSLITLSLQFRNWNESNESLIMKITLTDIILFITPKNSLILLESVKF